MGRGLILTILLLGGCKKTAAIELVDPTKPEIDLWSEQGLSAMLDELVPLVEKHGARRFETRPVVEVFDNEAFKAYVGRESRLIMDVIYRDTPVGIRAAEAEKAAKVGIGGIFGKYGLYDEKTYIVPESISGAASELGPDGAERLAKVVLAHELAHALQNQEYDGRETLPALIDLDHFNGWSCISEGGANFIARRVAKDLGLEEEFWILSGHQGWGRDGLEQPAAYDTWMRYGRGMDVLEQVASDGGMDAFWMWHQTPPVSSSMLFRPETYAGSIASRSLDYEAALRGTEQALTKGEWMTSNTRLGEYTLRGEAIRTGKEEELDPILAHLVDAQHLNLTMPNRTGDIRVLVFDAPEHARAYLELLRAEQTIEGQQLAKMLGITVEVTYAEVADVEGDASLLRTQRVPIGSQFRESRTAWVVRGADVVSVHAERFRPGLRLAQTLNAVFEQLETVRQEGG